MRACWKSELELSVYQIQFERTIADFQQRA
jgi:hypothetical protein